jgi:Ca2+:H+ antiporter
MIPLPNILGEATEALSFHTGETIGGLVNATFGNAVEVVVAIFALRKGEISVVQSSLIGSVLSNLLLVLGCSFIAGGFCNKENNFNAVGASANSSLLMLSSFAMLLPSYILYFGGDHDTEEQKIAKTLALSHIAALFLLFMYGQLLFFQLHTHLEFFQDKENEEEDIVNLSYRASAMTLLGATLLVSLFSEYLVSSIDGFTLNLHVSKSFVGIILLPIVGNAVEHVTAIKVAMNNKMELAMGVAVGSATQVSLFVVPVVVIAGWIMGEPMTLAFPEFEVLIYLMSIVIVYAIIADGKSNWLEGSMLLTAYALVAIALLWVHVPHDPAEKLPEYSRPPRTSPTPGPIGL